MKSFIKLISFCSMIFIITACSLNKSPEKVAETYINSILNGDTNALYQMTYFPTDDPEYVKEANEYIQFFSIEGPKYAKQPSGIARIEYGPVEYKIGNKKAVMFATILYNDGKKQEIPIPFIQIDNNWLIFMK